MERKTPKNIERYMCQGNTAKPLAKLLNTSENKDSRASVTTERRNIYELRLIILIRSLYIFEIYTGTLRNMRNPIIAPNIGTNWLTVSKKVNSRTDQWNCWRTNRYMTVMIPSKIVCIV